MSPGSGVKSEYMKRYREPRWDEYGPCYRELLHYRLGRRLLEQAHAPWLWDDWGHAGSSPFLAHPLSQSAHPHQGCRGVGLEQQLENGSRVLCVFFQPRPYTFSPGQMVAQLGSQHERPPLPVKEIKEKPEQQIQTKETDKVLNSTEPPRQHPSALFARGTRKAVKSPQRSSSKIKENKHPFALYGWGERQTATGSQKTHNVCASAPVHEIHESALRAKNRRQVEKRKLIAQRQRAHSVEVEKNRRIKPSPSENPWMTEYMRCYSARA
ncbi:hypothetical protein PANDA_010498, partial [Ailuropoda melanoleuca]